ncbi:MAG: hydantoinase B/oxoprolinase family protein [Rhodospirillales bacterium]|jgi:N-methylhydantoinase B|nr:hydantoinase B/oxoprolinase family protein [Rhodospirillales bacterium]MDP6646725.1 hydantoinase B/oxoprolinase family protein [Rhodospirillales bacterium]MDP6840582.1 hydantoinase B/oxoprolinase family protein [Rhodospirillales bacterium]|tara:strand:- start:202 stop:2379 length:2178 start_codon:yes stop_codon:yes gene_type:complete
MSSSPEAPIEQIMQDICWEVLTPIERLDVEIDPVKYEIAVHRIAAILREGCYALVRTSGSPIVTEVGEYMFAIFDAEGNAAYVTAGVLPHLVGTEGGVKFIRRMFADDILDGDQFIINDPYILGIHTPDVMVAKPVFHQGELLCWIGSLTHSTDIGAKDPGGVADSTDIFQEGIRLPGLKIVRQGRRAEEVFRLIKRGVRNPDIMELDVSSKIAGNNVVHGRIDEMIAKEGSLFLRHLLQKMIQETGDQARARIESIPDGTWRNRVYGDHTGLGWRLIWSDIVATKSGGIIHIDLSASSPQQPGPVNTPLAGSIGAIFSVLVSTIFWDLNWNKGIVECVRVTAPHGSMFNPIYPAPVYGSPPTTASLLAGNVTRIISEMSFAAGSESSVCAPWMSSQYGLFMGGKTQYGKFDATATFDANGGGTGATLIADGDDTSAFILAPGAMMADVESYEARFPLLYLFRRKRRNSGGYGEFQGGLGGEAGVMVHGTDRWGVGFRTIGHKVVSTVGIFGGYPADSSLNGYVFRPRSRASGLSVGDLNELLWVDDLLNQPGIKVTEAIVRPSELSEGDIYFHRWTGGGGCGDPLKRNPERVRADFEDDKLTANAVTEIYGVVLADGTVDHLATTRARDAIRNLRKKESTTGPSGTGPDRGNDCEPPPDSADGHLSCLTCSASIENPARRDRAAKELLHSWVDAEWMFYREYYCPKCWSLVRVEPRGIWPNPPG